MSLFTVAIKYLIPNSRYLIKFKQPLINFYLVL